MPTSTLRAGTAALHLLLLGGAALPLVTAASPAAAQAQTSQFRHWEGAWRLSDNKNWITIDTRSGLTALFWTERDGTMGDYGSITFDLPNSSATKLVGTLAVDRNHVYPVEMTLAANGQSHLLMLTDTADAARMTPYFARRVTKVGDMAGMLTRRQVEDRMIGRWKAAFGDLLIERTDNVLTGKIARPGGTTARYILRLRSFSGGDGSETSQWQWNDPTATQGSANLKIAISPDGRSLQGTDSEAEPFAGASNWSAVRADATPQPAPVPQPAPQAEPARTPPPASQPAPAPSVPGTLQAGVFHQLEAFDVRIDEVRAARDGRVHAFLTVRNKSGRDRTVGASLFTAILSDADGIGVRASHPYRAIGEEPTSFEGLPTIPAGGEFRLRYVLEPAFVHGPITALTIREGEKPKALRFAATQADPGASPFGAPAAGGGAFKPLSKFDVRIDRVAPSRDGKLEVFLTFRNPTADVQSLSRASIKLSAMNADGAKVSSRSTHYSVRGERGVNDEFPVLIYAEPGGEMRAQYVFDEGITGAITITDSKVSQTFTPGG